MSQSMLDLMRQLGRKRVSLDEIRRMFQQTHPELVSSPDRNKSLLNALQALVTAGVVQLPAKGSWEKFGNPPLPTWVQLVVDEKEPSYDFSLVPWVPEMGFWTTLKSAQLETARLINDFLLRRRGSLTLAPIKERSLEIFGNEKKLDELRKDDSVFGGRLPLSALGAFQVPLPLPYRIADAPGRPVLIVENHDSYWSFGEWNQERKQYAAVVYGSGLAFQSSGRALQQVLAETRGAGAEYLGDLDPAGISIPVNFNTSQAADCIRVKPALPFYAWLLQYGKRRRLEQVHESALILARSWLGATISDGLSQTWQEGGWIPQESLGIEMLRQDFFRT